MILCSGCYNVLAPDGRYLVSNVSGDSSQFTAMAVDTLILGVGAIFIAIAMFLFTFTTVMAYSVYLNSINGYLFKSDTDGARAKCTMLYIKIMDGLSVYIITRLNGNRVIIFLVIDIEGRGIQTKLHKVFNLI